MLHTMLSDGINGTWGTINGSSFEFCSWASMIKTPVITTTQEYCDINTVNLFTSDHSISMKL